MVLILRYTADLLEMRSFKRFETELAHLGFTHFKPLAPLRPWVQRYFHLRVATDLPQGIEQTFYPDGGTSLHFYFPTQTQTQTLTQTLSGEEPQVLFHCGQSRHCHAFLPGIELLAVRFHPGGAFHLLGVELQDIQSATSVMAIDATQLQLTGLDQLLSQLAQTNQPARRIALLEHWLLQLNQRQFDAALSRHKSAMIGLVQASLPKLIQTQASLEDFYSQLPLSRRQFERRFKQVTGLSPAQLLQLNRVKVARNLLSQSPNLSLVQVAFDCGFYDQAHLHQHFVRVTQQTPGQYKKRKMSQISNPTSR
ncbi:AraC family transcriptional regulator [Shewanella baltica]|uniref:AraC family transcriptional regulator n=1 Tax=Shewanella baltica TaxID=62322 RepID=UPI00217F1189|nr:helix-turn-helix domain-containing protein [Shewanella baltica]MCS6126068.1 AraC family transcriptional regulator [Shewanella baltica]MCS6138570.1 AraC family transcriptional regulator [Shewanella baltica]MCS6144438.1 AraC family transcriptional regulator [Shewanella baltica]MCS6168966.1 AraC family transcriptional regulator [Shewanella baltica]MCS6186060.1 AraC family transcriptional regulator [Shewanella baltica]